jgi:hypothetical protein
MRNDTDTAQLMKTYEDSTIGNSVQYCKEALELIEKAQKRLQFVLNTTKKQNIYAEFYNIMKELDNIRGSIGSYTRESLE